MATKTKTSPIQKNQKGALRTKYSEEINNSNSPGQLSTNPDPSKPGDDSSGPYTHVKIIPKGDEGVESLIRRFNREVMRAGIIRRMKELEFYEKPSLRRKREREERRRMRKQGYRLEEFEWVKSEQR